MSLVPTTRTPLTLREFAAAVLRNWSATGETTLPSEQSVAVLYGQFMQETGGLNAWNWNIGNHKYSGSGDYMYLKGTWELVSQAEADRLISLGEATLDTDPGHMRSAQSVGKVSVVFKPPHRSTWFQSFSSLDDGMSSHLRSVRKKFGKAWEALLDGDPGRFAQALKAQGYYSDSVSNYEAGVRRGYAEFLASHAYQGGGGGLVPSTGAGFPWGLAVALVVLGVGANYVLTRKGHRLPGLSKLRFT